MSTGVCSPTTGPDAIEPISAPAVVQRCMRRGAGAGAGGATTLGPMLLPGPKPPSSVHSISQMRSIVAVEFATCSATLGNRPSGQVPNSVQSVSWHVLAPSIFTAANSLGTKLPAVVLNVLSLA